MAGLGVQGVEFVLVLRSLAIIAWFFIIKTNRKDFLRFPAICRQFWDEVMGRHRQEDPENTGADRRYSGNSSLGSFSRGGKTRSFASSRHSRQGSMKVRFTGVFLIVRGASPQKR